MNRAVIQIPDLTETTLLQALSGLVYDYPELLGRIWSTTSTGDLRIGTPYGDQAVNSGDWIILGNHGLVHAVPKDLKDLKPGDRVVGGVSAHSTDIFDCIVTLAKECIRPESPVATLLVIDPLENFPPGTRLDNGVDEGLFGIYIRPGCQVWVVVTPEWTDG